MTDAIQSKAAELATWIDRFDLNCRQMEETDTGEAWDLLNNLRRELKALAGTPEPEPEPAPPRNEKPTLKGILAEFDVWTRQGLADAITAALERYDAHLNDPWGTDDGADAKAPDGDDYNEIGDLIQAIINTAMERR